MGLGEVITVAHTKGGTGKSSLASNLAYGLSERGFRVLAIDLDGQGSLGAHLGGTHVRTETTASGTTWALDSGAVLAGTCTIDDAVIHDVYPGLSIIPSSEMSLDSAITAMSRNGALSQLRLYELLDRARLDWDMVIIDTPGHQGMALATALVASTGILIPVVPEAGPVAELRTVLNGISSLSESTLPLEVYGIIRLRVGGNSNYRKIAEDQARSITAEYRVPLMRNKIPEDARFGEAQLLGVPVRAHDRRARSAIAYKYLIEELVERRGWHAPIALDDDRVPVSVSVPVSALDATVGEAAVVVAPGPADAEIAESDSAPVPA